MFQQDKAIGVVLASGAGSRFNKNKHGSKQVASIFGKPLVSHAVAGIRPYVSFVVVTCSQYSKWAFEIDMTNCLAWIAEKNPCVPDASGILGDVHQICNVAKCKSVFIWYGDNFSANFQKLVKMTRDIFLTKQCAGVMLLGAKPYTKYRMNVVVNSACQKVVRVAPSIENENRNVCFGGWVDAEILCSRTFHEAWTQLAMCGNEYTMFEAYAEACCTGNHELCYTFVNDSEITNVNRPADILRIESGQARIN